MKRRIRVHDPAYLPEPALKELTSTLYTNTTAVPYDAEYGTRVLVTMGGEVLQIIIPPDYKDDVVHVQMVHRDDTEEEED